MTKCRKHAIENSLFAKVLQNTGSSYEFDTSVCLNDSQVSDINKGRNKKEFSENDQVQELN